MRVLSALLALRSRRDWSTYAYRFKSMKMRCTNRGCYCLSQPHPLSSRSFRDIFLGKKVVPEDETVSLIWGYGRQKSSKPWWVLWLWLWLSWGQRLPLLRWPRWASSYEIIWFTLCWRLMFFCYASRYQCSGTNFLKEVLFSHLIVSCPWRRWRGNDAEPRRNCKFKYENFEVYSLYGLQQSEIPSPKLKIQCDYWNITRSWAILNITFFPVVGG